MLRVWLKHNWKDEFKEQNKVVVVEISGGNVGDTEVPEGVDLVIIDHDNLGEDIVSELLYLGYGEDDIEDPFDILDEIYDDVVKVLKEAGDDDVEEAVKIVMKDRDKYKTME